MRPLRILSAFLVVGLAASGALAQTPAPTPRPSPDSLARVSPPSVLALDRIEVRATRTEASAATAPLALTVQSRSTADLALDAGVSLERTLGSLPGLWIADRENYALGERLSVRGQGARAGFGVRGVTVVLDGVPLTLPDGQAALTIADPALVRQAELVRGPASTLWGNAGGGVLFLRTLPEEATLARVRVVGGSYGTRRAEAEGAAPLGPHRVGVALSHARREGYRAYSAYETTRARAFGVVRLGAGAELSLTAAAEDAPRQEHPGALTADELSTDPQRAEPRFVDQAAGKASRQGQLGAALRAQTPFALVTASVFGVVRSLDNPLPFAYIDLARQAGGARLAAERSDGPFAYSLGVEAGAQRDDRQNWANAAGTRGALRLDQDETVASGAVFGQAAWQRGPLTVSAGLRHDRVRFAARDRFLANGDQSGSRTLGAWSPSLGAGYRLGPALLFANASTAFETPTTTELANRPDGAGGFNADLGPKRTRGVEVGARGTTPRGTLFYDLALYRLDVQDQLVPFEGPDRRTYYRNAEAARHVGLEAQAEARPSPTLRVGATYGWSHFVFDAEDPVRDGQRVPGVPEHRLALNVGLTRGAVVGRLALQAASAVWADDANTARAPAYAALDAGLSHTGFDTPGGRLIPFAEVRNVLNARYAGSVALNAQGGRFFEPAAGRAFHLGLSLALR